MANARKTFVLLSMTAKKLTIEKVGRAKELQEEKGQRERENSEKTIRSRLRQQA